MNKSGAVECGTGYQPVNQRQDHGLVARATGPAMLGWCGVLLVSVACVGAELTSAKLVASAEAGWPQWRGPRRDGISDEQGLLHEWPEGGPKRLWSIEGLGFGYSAPIITGGTIYITGDIDGELHILALDLAGQVKWRTKNGKSWENPYPGSRSSCTYSQGRIYHMNAHGRVVCLDAKDGREVWAVNVLERFQGKVITWGLAENLLIDGDHVIVTPGGRKALMAALDKKTGATVWASEPLAFEREGKRELDGPSYASPVLFELAGRRHIASMSTQHAFGVDADTGKLLWTYPMPTRYLVLGLTPAVYKDCLFFTGPDSSGGKLLRVKTEGERVSVEEVWTADIDTCHGGVIVAGDLLCGTWYRQQPGWGCVDLRTGRTLHRTRELTMGSGVYADGRFYCLAQDGTMALVQADENQFRIISRFRLVPEKKSDVWTHPVIVNGRMYLRYHERLDCYEVSVSPRRGEGQ